MDEEEEEEVETAQIWNATAWTLGVQRHQHDDCCKQYGEEVELLRPATKVRLPLIAKEL